MWYEMGCWRKVQHAEFGMSMGPCFPRKDMSCGMHGLGEGAGEVGSTVHALQQAQGDMLDGE